MIPTLRQHFNSLFTTDAYNQFVTALENVYPGQLEFRIAETPVFVPKDFTNKMLEACEAILTQTSTEEYRRQSENAVPAGLSVPGVDEHPHCIAFDFGVCEAADGSLEPQLIEMQGFPTLFAWEAVVPEVYEQFFWQPDGFSAYLHGYNKTTYIQLLEQVIIGDTPKENVVLLELFPEKQKTRVDFSATEDLLGIKTICVTKLIKEGRQLYYEDHGQKMQIKKIYNRVIFDDLLQQPVEVSGEGEK